ncbi:related to protein tag-253 [Cephalotrichum gorgonifer]|uniref:Related to protein tag-253 n=1 Tax=Cephalotrichum gorgonifer TaxID=2041049 RepID=A0AAE8SUY5_9PEZI|nr:related to protein tag-253 [Cephalotrichum gorgonifer]
MSDRTRPASHAGSWYEDDPTVLSSELEQNLEEVPSSIHDSSLPIPGARVVIAPHAGYSYSGPCAAWAYKCLDLSGIKRVFVLGPSHTYYLSGCAVTTCSKYETPFGDLVVDTETTAAIKAAGSFRDIPLKNDISEHSLEMHLPYLYKRMQETFPSPSDFPTIVPLLVGDNDSAAEKAVGRLLAPHLASAENAFVVSSDFCHWGRRFDYAVYSPAADLAGLRTLPRGARGAPEGRPIHETIKMVDQLAMDAIETGSHDAFYGNIAKTKNTVCGRHPIGVTMAAMEEVREGLRFRFVQYQRSGLVDEPSDSSVSYGAAYAVV